MRLTGATKPMADLQQHVGWRSGAMPVQYARSRDGLDMDISQRLQQAIDGESGVTTHL